MGESSTVKLGHDQTKSIDASLRQALGLGQERSEGNSLVPPTEHGRGLSTSVLDSELNDKERYISFYKMNTLKEISQ